MAELDDAYPGQGTGILASCEFAEDITPHDTNNLPRLYKAIEVGATGGAVVCVDSAGNTVTRYFNPGEIKPIRPAIIKSTGTLATPIMGLW